MTSTTSPAGMAPRGVNTVTLVFSLIAGLVVFLRLFSRGLLLRKAGLEDAFIVLAMVLSIGLTVTIALQIQNGMGKHINQLTPQEMVDSQKAFWASVWIYNLALTATKISILIQYLRIFAKPRFRTVCCVVLGIVAAYGIWTLFGSIFLCFPVDFFWDKSIPNGKCLNQEAVWFINAGVNIAQDIIILFLPMPVLRSLSIPDRQKKALIVVFALGGLVCVISIIRLQSLVSISNSKDPTFDNPPAAILSAIETNVGIICACLPSLRPLLSGVMPSYFPDGSRYTNVRVPDEEQPKHMRHPSASSRPYTPGTPASMSKSSHSRTGSNGRTFTPGGTSRSGHSRNASGSSRAYSNNGRELGVIDSRQSTPTSASRGVNKPTHQPAPSAVHAQHNVHPLRMSPFSPPIPRLPRLPENVATVGPTDTASRSSRGSRRTPRTPVFHKPLPITPFPIMP